MVSNQITKIALSLEKKKFRKKYNLFKVEGEKLVDELLNSSINIHSIIANKEYLDNLKIEDIKTEGFLQVFEASEKEMKSISNFQSIPTVIALAHIPEYNNKEIYAKEELILALNGIQDPGNMGTILRIADWFGIEKIICDDDCADIYNPKVIQASMGAIFRKSPIYLDLVDFLEKNVSNKLPVYGTFLGGENIYSTSLSRNGIIIMGNEGKGISEEIEKLVDRKLTIPSFAPEKTSESLNVGVATGIILSEFKRRLI